MVSQGRGRCVVARTLTLTEKVQPFFFLSTAQCSYMNLSMVFFTFFQATLHGYVLSNETVDPIIPQLISVVRNDSLLTIPTTPVCGFNRI